MAVIRLLQKWIGALGLSERRPTARRSHLGARRLHLGARLCRMEPLEERQLLSVVAHETLADAPACAWPVLAAPSLVIGGGSPPLIDVSDGDATVGERTDEAIGENKDGPMAKMGTELTYLYFEYQAYLDGGGDPTQFEPSNTFLPVYDGRVAVDLGLAEPLTYDWVDVDNGVVIDTVTNSDVIQELEAAGLEQITPSSYSAGGLLPSELMHELEAAGLDHFAPNGYSAGASLPLDAIDDVAALDSVRSVWPAYSLTVGMPLVDVSASAQADGDGTSAKAIGDEVRAAFGMNKDGPMVKVGLQLTWLYYEYRAAVDAGTPAAEFKPSNTFLPVHGDRVAVNLSTFEPLTYDEVDNGVVVGKATNSELIQTLESAGLEDVTADRYMAGGLLPFDAIDDLAALDSVTSVWPAYRATSIGATTSQGDIAQRSDDLRNATGLDGTGVTVGVISDSYDRDPNALTRASDDVASGDLPGDVHVLDDSDTAGSDEGRAMLQIVHDVAPGADLVFLTTGVLESSFAAAISELASPESGAVRADVIVDDVIFLHEPMFMDGPVAQAVDAAVGGGVTYVSAAGNQSDLSYESPFRNSGNYYEPGYFPAPGLDAFAGGFAHDFDPGPGVDVFQSLTLDPGETVELSFQWDQPFQSVTNGVGASNDVDIYLFDSSGSTILADSVLNNAGGDPFEWFVYPNSGQSPIQLNLMIVKYSGSDPGLMKFVDFGSDPNNNRVYEYGTDSPTLFGHANAAGAIAVGGAAYFNTPEFGINPPHRDWYTSLGGTDILFDTDGNRLGTPEDRAKPDVVGPDWGNTTFFGVDIDRDADTYPNFPGTSAAAPHVAGVAALLLQAAAARTPQIFSTRRRMTSCRRKTISGRGSNGIIHHRS